MRNEPPKLANKILLSFLRNDLVEEVTGDLEEKFYSELDRKSVFLSKLNYWYQVLNYLRPFAIRKTRSTNSTYFPMYKNYLTIAWRNLIKQKMYSSIKIGGFALGIAACFLISLYIRDELSYDKHFPDKERLYRVVLVYNDNGKILKGVHFPAPFAKALKDDYPDIVATGRFNSSELFGAGPNQVRRVDKKENAYEEGFVYFDQELLEILQPSMIYGNPKKALDEPNAMVITKRKADKFFPGQNPVGKIMIVNNDEKNPMKIKGVIEDFPSNSHLNFDFLVSMKGREFWDGEQNYWGASNYHTYLKVRKGADITALESKIGGITSKYMLPNMKRENIAGAEEILKNFKFTLQAVPEIHLNSGGIHDGLSHGDMRFIWIFGAIALFILVIAAINFINLSTAKSANRAKEVGLRKVVGSYRSSLIRQFLTESTLFSLLSFGIGIVLAFLLLPFFNSLSSKSIAFPFTEWWLFPLITSASLLIGLLAGLYPSFYLSGFKPIQVLKGNLSRGSKNSTTRNSLVVFQFTTSIVLIVGTFIIYRQMNYILNKKVGYDKEQVLLLHGASTLQNEIVTFKSELLKLPAVKHASISDFLPVKGTKRNSNGFWVSGTKDTQKPEGAQTWAVDHDYVKALGIKIVEGRDFSIQLPTDSQAVIVNQAMVKKLGIKNPIGTKIENWKSWTIIGVMEDFHFSSLKENIEPLCLHIGRSPGIISVKVNTKDMKATLESINKTWKSFSPNQPIRYTFLDENFAQMYEDVQRMGRIFTSFSVFAIIVACLGLFALSAFMVEQRSKEIGIRLVLGASMYNILHLLTQNFVKLVLISVCLAVPIAWYSMQKWLDDYEYKIDITWDVFVIAGIISTIIALITISYQSVKAALMSPVNTLKSE